MPYTAKQAVRVFDEFFSLELGNKEIIENTKERGCVITLPNDEKAVVFIYPIVHKLDNTKNYFDTRDSGAKERAVSWNYAIENNLKYFCIGINSEVEKYAGYFFSLECNEHVIEKVSGTLNGERNGPGNQIIIPNDYIPTKEMERIINKLGIYICAVNKIKLVDYLMMYDNRPYMIESSKVDLSNLENEEIETDTSEGDDILSDNRKLPPYNRILFGAPGTGKSYALSKECKTFFPDSTLFERVTFHPAYSYAQFFGTYKPVSEDKELYYRFVPGPFLRLLLKALSHPDNRYLFIIEEINRADVAAVFGDIFQLLDRTKGVSDYAIDISEDLKRFIDDKGNDLYPDIDWDKLGEVLSDNKLRLPNNFYIWATMNSADQGVNPLDTAFKRRWTFEYLNINDGAENAQFATPIDTETGESKYVWPVIRERINTLLSKMGDIAEDRWLGPFFLKNADFDSEEVFEKIFKSKVLMYLYQDIGRYTNQEELFKKRYSSYSALCEDFDKEGIEIFSPIKKGE